MPISKTRLLIITTTFPRWKNDTDPPFVYELARRLTSDFQVTVHTPHYPGAKQAEDLSGVRVHRFRYFFSCYEKIAGQGAILPFLQKNKGYYLILPFFLLAQFFSLFLLIRKTQPDVIHAHWLVPTAFFAVLGSGKRPVVVTGHGADVFGMQGALLRWAKKFVLRRAATITVVSDALKRAVMQIGVPSCPLKILPMGVDSTIFTPTKNFPPTGAEEKTYTRLLFVGRLSEKKGVKYLLDAMVHVRKRHPYVQLCIIGDGEEKKDLHARVSMLDLGEHVSFTGAVSNRDLPQYYAQADIFIGPSIIAKDGDAEGFGLTFIEASFSGCFLIGTRTGGIGDIIQHKQTGLLAQPEDSFDLAEKICWAFEHPSEVEEMKGEAKKEHVEQFDWSIVARKYGNLLYSLCENRLK